MHTNTTDSETPPFPKKLDIAKVCVYGLAILSAGLLKRLGDETLTQLYHLH